MEGEQGWLRREEDDWRVQDIGGQYSVCPGVSTGFLTRLAGNVRCMSGWNE